MQRYATKRVFILATQWDESKQTLENIGCGFQAMRGHRDKPDLCENLRIMTVNGSESVSPGDYIAKNENGSFAVWEEATFNRRFDAI